MNRRDEGLLDKQYPIEEMNSLSLLSFSRKQVARIASKEWIDDRRMLRSQLNTISKEKQYGFQSIVINKENSR